MLLFIIRMLYVVISVGAIVTYVVAPNTGAPKIVQDNPVFASLVMFLIASSILLLDILIPRKRVEVISAIYFGLLIGVLLAYLLNLALQPIFASRELFGPEARDSKGLSRCSPC